MRLKWPTTCILVTSISQVIAQDFTVPSIWRDTTSNLTSQDRLSLVDGLMNTVTRTFNASSGRFEPLGLADSAHMTHSISTFDYINSSLTYETVVREALNATFSSTLSNTGTVPQANSDTIQWGVAAISAYRAYQDNSLMAFAESAWTQGSAYLVTPEDAASGKHPTRNVTFPSTCNGVTTAGAVFNVTNAPDNLDVNAETAGSLLVLSARLHEYTSDTKYLTAAQLIFDFISRHLFNGKIILDGMDLGTCQIASLEVTANAGWVIDGLSTPIFGVTNSSYASFLSNLVSTAIHNLVWTNPSDGIIIEGPTGSMDPTALNSSFALKGIYIRGLYERYMTIPSDTPEATLIRSHITVQFNALLDLASTPGSNQYSTQWEGGPPFSLSLLGQLAAADVLFSAVGLTHVVSENVTSPATTTSGDGIIATMTPSTPPTSSGSDINRTRSLSGAAIGGIAAGAAVLVLLIMGAFLIYRRRKRQLERQKLLEMETAPRPYSESRDFEAYHQAQIPENDINANPPMRTRPRQIIASKYADRRSSYNSQETRRTPTRRPRIPTSNSTPSGSVTSPSSVPRYPGEAEAGGSQGSGSVVVDLTSHPRLFARLARAAQAMESAPHVAINDSIEDGDEELPRYER